MRIWGGSWGEATAGKAPGQAPGGFGGFYLVSFWRFGRFFGGSGRFLEWCSAGLRAISMVLGRFWEGPWGEQPTASADF